MLDFDLNIGRVENHREAMIHAACRVARLDNIIPARYVDVVKLKIDKLSRRAVRLGVVPPTVNFGEPFTVEFTYRNVWGTSKLPMELVQVNVTGEVPKIVDPDGREFKLIAKIEHIGETNLVKKFPGVEADLPEIYRTRRHCDHCNSDRRRNATYIIQLGNEYIQVGSGCIKDYFGWYKSPEEIVKHTGIILDFQGVVDPDELEAWGESCPLTFELMEFLATTVAYVNDRGYVSKAKAYELGNAPTAEVVMGAIEDRKYAIDVVLSDYEEAENVFSYWAYIVGSKDQLTDYEYNVITSIRLGVVIPKTAGLIASMVPAYNRFIEKQYTPKTVSEYVGTVGKRETFTVTLIGTNSFDSYYGTTTLYRFTDEAGNILVWFSGTGIDISVGDTVTVKATVKKQELYGNTKQTTLTRVKAV